MKQNSGVNGGNLSKTSKLKYSKQNSLSIETILSNNELSNIKWLHNQRTKIKFPKKQSYGDLQKLNTSRKVFDALGKNVVRDISGHFLDLLETSGAILENNGDYVVSTVSSRWCRFLDESSRKLCKTSDNKMAMDSGKWLCHNSCQQASELAIKTGRPADIKCNSGLRIYAEPIRSRGKIIGSLNMGYGDPPSNKINLQNIADKFKVNVKKLELLRREYDSRPAFIIDNAKKLLSSTALLIGEMVDRRVTEDELKRSKKRYRELIKNLPEPVLVVDKNKILFANPMSAKMAETKTIKNIVGRLFTDFLYPNSRDLVLTRLKETLEEGKSWYNVSEKFITVNGNLIEAKVTVTPIEYEGKTCAQIIIREVTERRKLEHAFNQLQKNLQERVLNQTENLVIINSQLNAEIAERKKAEMDKEVLQRLSHRLTSHLSLVTMAELIADEGKQLFDYDAFSLGIIDHGKNLLIGILCKDSAYGSKILYSHPTFDIELKSYQHKSVLSGQTKLINHNIDPIQKDKHAFGFQNQVSKSRAYIPIISEKKTIGVISFQSYTLRKYLKNDLPMMEAFADHIAGAISRITANEELRKSEEMNSAILKSTPDLMLILDAKGTLIDCKGAENSLFFPKEQFIGKSLREILPADLFRKLMKHIILLKKTNKLQSFEYDLSVNGELLHFEARLVKTNKNFILCNIHDRTKRQKAEQELRESEDIYRSLFEYSIEGIATYSGDVIISANRACLDIFGYKSLKKFKQISIIDHTAPSSRELIIERIKHRAKGKTVDSHIEFKIIRKNGDIREVIASSTLIKIGKDNVVQTTFRDITKRKQVEIRLQESEEKFKTLVDHAPIGIYYTDFLGTFQYGNEKAEEIVGFKSDELIGKSFLNLKILDLQEMKRAVKLFSLSILGIETGPDEFTIHRKDGTIRNVSINTRVIKIGGKNVILGMVQDISQRLIAEIASEKAALEIYKSREQLRNLAARLQSIREEERMRISRELHDDLGSQLTVIKIDLMSLIQDPSTEKERKKTLKSISSRISASLKTTKKMATDLRPGVLDPFGLKVAIKWLLRDFEKQNKIKCHTWLTENLPEMNNEEEITLFRILQEALTNIIKHADATRLKVTLYNSGDLITLTIKDNGKGFKPSKVDSTSSLGLLSMHERAYSVGGELIILGEPGIGTKITVSIPIT